MQETIARITHAEQKSYREACAMLEIAQLEGNHMSLQERRAAWLNYYQLVGVLYERYDLLDYGPEEVTIMPATGRILVHS